MRVENFQFVIIMFLLLTACSPTDEAIQIAIAQTRQAYTATSIISIPIPTKTPSQPTYTTTPTLLPPGKVLSPLKYLINVRAEPSLNGKIINQLSPDTIIYFIGRSQDGQWFFITDYKIKGWMHISVIKTEINFNDIPVSTEVVLTYTPKSTP
jgi:hypothetical protein